MGQFEMNEGLARAAAKKGETRNPKGGGDTTVIRLRTRDMKQLMRDGGEQPCEQPGYEHLNKFQYIFGIHIWDRWPWRAASSRSA